MGLEDDSFGEIKISKKGINITAEGRPDIFVRYTMKDGHVVNVPYNAEVIFHVGDYFYFMDREGKIVSSEKVN